MMGYGSIENNSLLERTPLLNRLFGYGTHYRTTQLLKKKSTIYTRPALKVVLGQLEEDDVLSRRNMTLGIFALIAHFFFGTVVMMVLEGWSFSDASYFSIVTITTVGYGDLSPTSNLAKMFVIFYVFVSIAIVSSYLAYFVGIFLEQQEDLLVTQLIKDEDEEDSKQQIESLSDLDPNDYGTMTAGILMLIVTILCGALTFMLLEGYGLVDAVYVTVISSTTVGYGDMHPTNSSTKLIMTVWLILSTISVAKVISDFTDVRMQAKERAITKRVLSARIEKSDMKLLDRDDDGTVLWGEYLSNMLISLGKVTEEEVDAFRTKFNEHDYNNDGRISISDN